MSNEPILLRPGAHGDSPIERDAIEHARFTLLRDDELLPVITMFDALARPTTNPYKADEPGYEIAPCEPGEIWPIAEREHPALLRALRDIQRRRPACSSSVRIISQ